MLRIFLKYQLVSYSFQYCKSTSSSSPLDSGPDLSQSHSPPPTCSFPGQTSYTSFEYHYTSPNLLGSLASISAAVKETVWCTCPPGSAYARGDYRIKRPARGMTLVITTYTCKKVNAERGVIG